MQLHGHTGNSPWIPIVLSIKANIVLSWPAHKDKECQQAIKHTYINRNNKKQPYLHTPKYLLLTSMHCPKKNDPENRDLPDPRL